MDLNSTPESRGMKKNMKSRFNLWGPIMFNGQKRWGINERRAYGAYTYGPHNGWDTRREAVAALRTVRALERKAAARRLEEAK